MDPIDTLLMAASQNDIILVKWALTQGVSVNAKNEEGTSALHEAVCGGHERMVRRLLNRGALGNSENNVGDTPLHIAALLGHHRIVEMLLNAEVPVDIQNSQKNHKQGNTALHEAAAMNHQQVVAILLDNHAYVDIKNEAGNTPLMVAAQTSSYTIVAKLLDKGALINRQNQDGNTALHEAASKGARDIVKLLIKRGASLQIKNNQGHTPLHAAAHSNRKVIVRSLLKCGVYTYTHGSVDHIVERLWENPIIRSSADKAFYTTLLSAGVDTHGKKLPQSLQKKQIAMEATVSAWLAPLSLSDATCREITPRVLRAFPRLIHWVNRIIKAEKIRSQEQGALKDSYNTLEEYREGLKHFLLMTKIEEEQAKAPLGLNENQQAVLRQLQIKQVPLEIMEVIRAQLIIKVLADTLTQIYLLPTHVAHYLAGESLAHPHQYRSFYQRLKHYHWLTACAPPLASKIDTSSSLQARLVF